MLTLLTEAHDKSDKPATVEVPDEHVKDAEVFLAWQRLMLAFADVLRSDKKLPLSFWDLHAVADRIFVSKFHKLRDGGVFRSVFDAHTPWTAKKP